MGCAMDVGSVGLPTAGNGDTRGPPACVLPGTPFSGDVVFNPPPDLLLRPSSHRGVSTEGWSFLPSHRPPTAGTPRHSICRQPPRRSLPCWGRAWGPAAAIRRSRGPWGDCGARFRFPFRLPMESLRVHVRLGTCQQLGTSRHRDQLCCHLHTHTPFSAKSASSGNRAKAPFFFLMLLARPPSPSLPGCAPRGDRQPGDTGTRWLVWVPPQLCVAPLSSSPCGAPPWPIKWFN